MERVIDPEAASRRARPSPATGWPARPAPPSGWTPACGCYDGTTVSFAGFAPADDPEFTVYVVVAQPAQRRWWRLGRRPGVRQDHELRAAPLPGPADRHDALAPPRRVVTRARHRAAAPRGTVGRGRPRSIASAGDQPGPVAAALLAATRPQRAPVLALDDLAAWLAGSFPAPARGDPAAVSATLVSGVSLSSQRIAPGDLYAALPGARAHGIDFAADAVAAGAVAVLTDPDGRRAGPRRPAARSCRGPARCSAASRRRSTASPRRRCG